MTDWDFESFQSRELQTGLHVDTFRFRSPERAWCWGYLAKGLRSLGGSDIFTAVEAVPREEMPEAPLEVLRDLFAWCGRGGAVEVGSRTRFRPFGPAVGGVFIPCSEGLGRPDLTGFARKALGGFPSYQVN